MSIHAILEEVRGTASKNDKIAILSKSRDFPFLKEFLFYTYAPHLNFYMKKIPPGPYTHAVKIEVNQSPAQVFETQVKRLVAQLTTRKTTGNDAKWLVVNALSHVGPEEQDLLKQMLLGDVKAGINISTLNKVWPKMIFEAPYMRCSLEDEAKPENWDWETSSHYCQLKADGMFANVVRNRGYAKFVTRQGNMFPQGILGKVEEDAERLFNESVYHGELTVFDNEEQVLLPRQTGNGILNSCLQGGELDPRYTVRYEAWDVVPYGEWYKGECKVPYNERIELLSRAIDRCDSGLISLIETHEVGSLAEAKELCANWMRHGFEGGVLKNAWMPWKDHTSKLQVKVKAEVDVELRAKALVAGSGKNADLFGSISFDSECGEVEVDVSGFSDEMRKEIHAHWDSHYKCMVATIRANALLAPSKSNPKHSLFLPRFQEWRYDKKVADDLAKIKAQFAAIGG